MLFLPGDHVLDTNITVANVDRLTMHGESSSGNRVTVVCNGSVGLLFISMVDLKIDTLAFTSCNRKYDIALRDLDIPVSNYFIHDFRVTVHVALLLQSTHAELVNCLFHDNLAIALAVNNTNITLSGNTEFTQNTYHLPEEFVCRGGAVTAIHSNLIFTGNTTLLENSAVCFYLNSVCSWGAILTFDNTVLKFSGTNNFINNSAFVSGGAIYALKNTVVNFTGMTNFINNSADNGGGAIYANTNVTLTFNGTVTFTHNVHRGGTDILTRHVAGGGGGVYMGLRCTFSILPNTTVYWENNHATRGGAIYVRDASPISDCTSVAAFVPKEECFFQLPGQNLSNGMDARLVFKNNFADVAGSMLYGGAIDNCKLTDLDSNSSGEVFDMLVHIEDDNDYSTTSKFLLTHFAFAHVKTIFQTVVRICMIFHMQSSLVKYFKFLWLQLDKEMEQLLAEW